MLLLEGGDLRGYRRECFPINSVSQRELQAWGEGVLIAKGGAQWERVGGRSLEQLASTQPME